MIINFSDHIEKLQMVRSGKIKEGLKLDIPEIDEHFRFKTSNFNVILGHANTGKTTVILYLMLLYSIKHNLKWLVFSSENEPYTLMKKMIEFMEGNVINKIEEKHFKNRSEFINEHFKFIDPQELYSYKNILDLATELKKAWNYQGLLIDPFNSLIKDKDLSRTHNGHEYDYFATSEMRVFCKKNQISLWLNTHANTEALRKRHSDRHEYAGHPIPPMASDVEGGGKFVNRADDFIVIHRYIQHPTEWMNSLIHVRKVKDVDTGGRPTSIDSPIVLRSVKNNVGFEINGKNLLDLPKRVQTDLPF
jgi:archaellum biogenesis ATPase FlaH|tara:strand:- start:1051 stop:1965 length:915 start_codon:yes stop_codon:yes gene_type:complete